MSTSASPHTGTPSGQGRHRGITRRAFAAGAALLAAVGPAVLLAGCSQATATNSFAPAGGAGSSSDSSRAASSSAGGGQAASSSSAERSMVPETRGGAGRVLVAYFSATGHTDAVAQTIAERLGTDLFSLTPSEPYTQEDLNYNDEASRVSREVDERDSIDVALEQVAPDGWYGYDTVFVGYPIGWQDFSWVMGEFLAGNDFTGKTVVPFCTSAAFPLDESDQHAAQTAGTGDWLPGMRFPAGASSDDVEAWLDSVEL